MVRISNGKTCLLLVVLFVFLLSIQTIDSLRCDFKEVNVTEEETEILCSHESKFCYALWKPSNESGVEEPIFLKQGCWEASPKSQCENEFCTSTLFKGSKKDNLFCCCSTDYCNSNVTFLEIEKPLKEVPADEANPKADESNSKNFNIAYVAIIAFVILIIIITTVMLGSHFCWKRQDRKVKVDNCEAGQQLLEPSKDKNWEVLGPVILGQEIARGKFGTVYTGISSGSKVALKVFSPDQREFFENEKYIYQILEKCQEESNLDARNIIRFHGYSEYTALGSANLILVLQRINPGTLRDALSASFLTLPQTIKLMRGIAKGMSFLHGENKDGVIIAHRDLTSKNILVDENFTPYLSDFGLSLRINGSKYYFAGEEHQAELNGLSEVGTQRYMAPELLDGAVNLKDCENALKQMDVYALALILWEVGNVCTEFRLTGEIQYVLPYEVEIGKDITKENLTRFVVTRRDRPSFVQWRDSQLTRSIRDTLNESWDPEPDARLTVLCIVERLTDISTLNIKSDSTTPLEVINTASSWVGRNSCLERNLMDRSEDKSNEYLLQSEKHKFSSFFGNSSTEGESVITQHTDLSNGSGLTQDIISPATIPFLHNITRN